MGFFLFATTVWGLSHYYMGRKFVARSALTGRRKLAAWAVLGMLILVPWLAMFASRAVAPSPARDGLYSVGLVTAGFSSVLFVLAIAIDAFALAGSALVVLRSRLLAPDVSSEVDPERRQFMSDVVNLGLIASAGGVTGVGVAQARQTPRVVEVDVPIESLPPALEGFRIVQLTDVHVGPTIKREYLERVVRVANGLDADVCAVTGDLVDGLVDDMRHDVEPLGGLRARHGTFFVTGNHEYYWDGAAWCDEVARLGLITLNNEHRVIEHGDARLLLAGVTDHRTGGRVAGHASDPVKAMADAPVCDLKVLLAHQPRSVFGAQRAGYDLQISGHTHGGQYFPMSILVHLFQPYVAGLHWFRSMWIYVSRGTGYWGPPMRVGASAEITLLRLVRPV